MTYFNLRKRAPEPEPEPDEEVEEQAPEEEPEAAPPTGALSGVSRWFAWSTRRIGGGTTLGVHAVAVWACFFYGGLVAITVIVVFVLVVAACTPREHIDRLVAWIEKHDREKRGDDAPLRIVEPSTPTDPQVVYEATLEWVWDQIGEKNGVHLADLLAHAHTHGMHTTLDVPTFRAALERHGFPIRQQLKVGRRNRPGIHRDDLPKTPSPDSSPEEDSEAATSAEYHT